MCTHLRHAFAPAIGCVPRRNLPNAMKDYSFLAYRNNEYFWMFVDGLHWGRPAKKPLAPILMSSSCSTIPPVERDYQNVAR